MNARAPAFYGVSHRSGPFKGRVLDMATCDTMLNEYCQRHGWHAATDIPKPERLRELGLADVAAKLAGRDLTQ